MKPSPTAKAMLPKNSKHTINKIPKALKKMLNVSHTPAQMQ